MEEKNTKGKKLLILGIVLVVLGLISFGTYYFLSGNKGSNGSKELEKRPELKDDFYGYVNYETLKNATIPNDSSAWSHMYDVSKTIEKRQTELTNEILADPNYKNEDIDVMLELVHDYEGRNKRGLDELKPYLEMVDNVKTIEDYNKLVLKLDEEFDR